MGAPVKNYFYIWNVIFNLTIILPIFFHPVNVVCFFYVCCIYLNADNFYHDNKHYYIPINDTSFELSVFWLSDTESRISKLRFSDSVSLSFKTRLTSVTCFAAMFCQVNFKHGTRDRQHDDVTSRNVT